MRTTKIDTNLVESYFSLLKGLSSNSKLALIEKLSTSIRQEREEKDARSLDSLYGSFESEKSADELITEIKKARTFNRKREEF